VTRDYLSECDVVKSGGLGGSGLNLGRKRVGRILPDGDVHETGVRVEVVDQLQAMLAVHLFSLVQQNRNSVDLRETIWALVDLRHHSWWHVRIFLGAVSLPHGHELVMRLVERIVKDLLLLVVAVWLGNSRQSAGGGSHVTGLIVI
jgi:hypothetical protein